MLTALDSDKITKTVPCIGYKLLKDKKILELLPLKNGK
jgi:hypothetical protein